MRDFQVPGRSPIYAANGMAATSHPLATQAAINTLNSGGNALDAAISACAVQGVVEPGSTGIGGDCFCLYSPGGSDEIIAYNGSGRTPGAATRQWYAKNNISHIDRHCAHAVTVPGAVEAWARLNQDHGKLTLKQNLSAAINHARHGFPLSPRVSWDFAYHFETLNKDPDTAKTFLLAGKPPQPGEQIKLPQLAHTLEEIGNNGHDVFYNGHLAEEMVSRLNALGGLHTIEDFSQHKGEYVTPISTTYKGYQLYECPPNGQGMTALLLLNIIQKRDLGSSGPMQLQRIHQEIEAGRIAYGLRNQYLGDPNFADLDIDTLLSNQLATTLAARISTDKVNPPMPPTHSPKHKDTVCITVVDKDRNCASFINSLFDGFGSGIITPKSGILLHNRAQGFVMDPHSPNCIGPNKRPLHTIIPAMLCKDGKVVMSFGVMGGHYQAFGHMQLLTRILNDHMDIQEAIDAPRFFPDPNSLQVDIESTVPEQIQNALRELGHQLNPIDRPIGGAQAIAIDWETGTLVGGSDSRKDGSAIGY